MKSDSSTRPILGQLAAAPFGTEAGLRFLQHRVALYARVQGFISFGFWSLGIVLTLAMLPHLPLQTTVLHVANGFHLAAAVCALAIWLIARRGRASRGQLVWMDLGATLLPMFGYAAMGMLSHSHTGERSDLIVMLIAVLVLMMRATLVPSRPKVTALISTAATLPVLPVSYVVGQNFNPMVPPAALPLFMSLWCAATIVTATLASRVIYGLRQKAAEAERLGQYVLEQKIGEGGMGSVYRARHALLRRPTAIKLLPADKVGAQTLSRFEREVQQTSRLTHPNTVAIYDYGHTPTGVFYYAMELLEGLDLQELIERYGAQPPARVIHILAQVLGSLAEAHGFGLVHRDIKPANIILCERGGIPDTAKVVDFGLVKNVNAEGDASLSNANAILGTPLYMSPESIVTPESVDARADLYALAAVGYFLLAGEPVFSGKSLVEVCGMHLHDPPLPPSTKSGKPLPGDLERVILTCLEKKPEHRMQSARAMRDALLACDVPAWSEADAKRWWSDHAGESAPASRARELLADSPTVVAVNMTERTPFDAS